MLVNVKRKEQRKLKLKTLFKEMKNLTETCIRTDEETYPEKHVEGNYDRGIFAVPRIQIVLQKLLQNV